MMKGGMVITTCDVRPKQIGLAKEQENLQVALHTQGYSVNQFSRQISF